MILRIHRRPITSLLVVLIASGVLGMGISAEAKPKLTVLEHPSPDELAVGFAKWAAEYPHAFRVEPRGMTPGGRPILMGRITDYGVPDEDKQVAMLTSCHVAKELNAGTGLLRLMKWLIGDDPAAAEIRKRQVVLVVPYTDPDGIASGKLQRLREIYGGIWTAQGVVKPDKHPEAAILQGIMDEYQPDLFIDFHGFNYAQQTMWESTGISWASAVSRCYLHDVPRLIDEAAEAEGFLITKGEQDAGQILTTSDISNGRPEYFYLRKSSSNITLYPYIKFHSLSFIMEVGFEESLIARTRRALQIGHERWRGERYEGYPTNQVGIWTLVAVSAWGTTAQERRQSRCELWQKSPQLTYGTAGPIPRDSIIAYVATTPAAGSRLRFQKLPDVMELIRGNPRFDADALADAAQHTSATGFGGNKYHVSATGEDVEPIRHGLVIRLLVPYNDAEVTEIRLDGHPIEESATDGYQIRRNPGTIVEIAIPPSKVAEFHIASCSYASPTPRRAGFRPEDW